MTKAILNTGILGLAFLLLFAFSEFLYYKLKVRSNTTRKIVHIGTGILTLLFPVMLADHWLVLLLCATFAIILIISLRFNLLRSINSIDRISAGSILYPLAVYCCYLFYTFFGNDLILFYLPVLTLAICDPVAAFVGERWPYGKFNIGKHQKTLIGSISLFISSVILSLLLYSFLSTKNLNEILLISFIIAAFSSIVEAVSIKGSDNITIPASVMLILTLFP